MLEVAYDTIVEAASVRQAQEGDGHRLDSICLIPTVFDANIHGAYRWCFKNFTSDTVLPQGISTTDNVVTNICFDNFDLLEETLSGAGTTHTTHGIVIQELAPGAECSDEFSDIQRSRQCKFQYTHLSLPEVRLPTKPEPVISPVSPAAYDTSNNNAVKHGCLAWTFSHALCNLTNTVPEWNGWVSVTADQTNLQPSNIRYLKPVMHPITQYSTIQQCLQTAMEITCQVKQEHTFVTFDLAAAKLALSLSFGTVQICTRT